MPLNKLCSTYNQKSFLFLYPLLGISKRSFIHPVQTYIASPGNDIEYTDGKLLCLYIDLGSEAWEIYQTKLLLCNPLYEKDYKTDDGRQVYVFDFSKYIEDWDNFLIGSYSGFSTTTKMWILNRLKKDSDEFELMSSFLFPDKYRYEYSRLLDVPVKLIGSELAEKPDLEKEEFKGKLFLENTLDYQTNNLTL